MATNSPANDQEPNAEQEAADAPATGLSKADNSENTSEPAEPRQRSTYKQKDLKVIAFLGAWTFWERFSILAEALLAGAVAYFAYVQATVSEGQLGAMKDQGAEMITQRNEMAKQTAAAKGQLEQMIEQSKGAEEQSRLARRQLEIAQGQLEQATAAADATAAAVEQASLANAISRASADAATAMSSMAAISAEKQLRAYISVDGVTMTFDRTRQMATARVTLRNNGATYAHGVRPDARVYCHPKGTQGDPAEPEVSAPSIGPNSQFTLRLEKACDGEISEMEFWIEGTIHYSAEFAGERFTNFKLYRGAAIPGSPDSYGMMYDPDGNDAN